MRVRYVILYWTTIQSYVEVRRLVSVDSDCTEDGP